MDILSFFDSTNHSRCIVCGCLVRKDKAAILRGKICVCENCNNHLPIVPVGTTFAEKNGHVSYTMSTFFYKSPIRELIIDYKFNHCRAYSEIFAEYMKIYISAIANHIHADLIIPVPLSKERLKRRKYNQAQLLSEPLAEELNIPHESHALIRTMPTVHQSRLPSHKRGENLKNAFLADTDLVKNKSILLIDDVYTTGNTLKACAYALHKAGAGSIGAYTLARRFRIDKSQAYNELLNN